MIWKLNSARLFSLMLNIKDHANSFLYYKYFWYLLFRSNKKLVFLFFFFPECQNGISRSSTQPGGPRLVRKSTFDPERRQDLRQDQFRRWLAKIRRQRIRRIRSRNSPDKSPPRFLARTQRQVRICLI